MKCILTNVAIKRTKTGKGKNREARLLHGITRAKRYDKNKPIMELKFENDDKILRSRDSTDSPTYVSIEASPRPIAMPKLTEERYSILLESAVHRSIQPIKCGGQTNMKHVFRPYLSWMYEDNRPPTGWNIKKRLPKMYNKLSALA